MSRRRSRSRSGILPSPARFLRAGAALLVAAGVLSATACATRGSRQPVSDDPFAAARAGKQIIRIHVTNLNFADATLWAFRGGTRIRLGTVGGKQDGVFTMDWPHPDRLQMQIDLLGGGRCNTRVIETDPGDEIDLQIDVVLSRSSLCR